MNTKKLMKATLVALLGSATLVLNHGTTLAAKATCPTDGIQVGTVCVDKYEASVWEIPASNAALIKKVQKGTATFTDLTAGGTQRGAGGADNYPCDDNGNDCDIIYAVSIAGVKPSTGPTWFQAQQACMNAGKRLLTNAEWQGAAAGTPDPGTDNGSTDCNITFQGVPSDPANTGSRANCVSRWGAFDMAGNVWEWVADWGVPAATCTAALYNGDVNCLAGASTAYGPAALARGGDFVYGTGAGVFAVFGYHPSTTLTNIGFRCGR